MARQMKDSGVEWIGEIPEVWSSRKLKTLVQESNCLFIDGDWIESKDISSDGIRYYTTGNVGDGVFKEQGAGYISEDTFRKLNCTEVRGGDLVFSRLNLPVGRACIIPAIEKCVVAVDIVIARLNSQCINKYVVYATMCDRYQALTSILARGTTMQRISRTQMGNIYLPMPSYAEQKSIVTYLDTKCAEIDKVVEQTCATIEEYKKLKQAIITEAVTKGVRGSRPMKTSGVEWIGDIPEEWHERKVSQFWKAQKGPNAALLTAEYCGNHSGVYPVYSGQTENNGIMGMIDSFVFDFGDNGCLFSTTVGAKAMTVSCLYHKFSLSQNCMIMQPITGECHVRYYFYLFTFIFCHFRSLIPDYMQPSFRVKDFYSYTMLLPSVAEQQEIAAYLDAKCAEIDRIIEKKEQLITELGSYKKSLIYEYVTGKREIKIHQYS